jgi:hypothetical protein
VPHHVTLKTMVDKIMNLIRINTDAMPSKIPASIDFEKIKCKLRVSLTFYQEFLDFM